MGYVECRGHLTFMDPIGDQFDVNDHAGRRLNKRIKDALDPNGILSPGRQGIWPTVFRREAEARRAVGAADHPQVPASVL